MPIRVVLGLEFATIVAPTDGSLRTHVYMLLHRHQAQELQVFVSDLVAPGSH